MEVSKEESDIKKNIFKVFFNVLVTDIGTRDRWTLDRFLLYHEILLGGQERWESVSSGRWKEVQQWNKKAKTNKYEPDK